MCETWIGTGPDPLRSAIPAEQSEDRGEAVLICVSDGEQVLLNMLKIERDWQTGKARLSDPDYTEAVPAQFPGHLAFLFGLADPNQ